MIFNAHDMTKMPSPACFQEQYHRRYRIQKVAIVTGASLFYHSHYGYGTIPQGALLPRAQPRVPLSSLQVPNLGYQLKTSS